MKEQIEINNKIGRYNIPIIMDIPKNSRDIFIMCHGFWGSKDSSITEIISDELVKNKIGVVAFDFPVHGKSDATIEKLTVNNCMSDINLIAQFLRREFPESDISLFASSFGAYVAINTFLDNLEHFKYVILQSPAVNMKEVLVNSLLKEDFEDYQKNGIAKAGRNGKMRVLYSFYEDLKEHDLLKKLTNLKQRMLIFHGTVDDTALIEDTRKFANLNSDFVRLIEIPNANHKMEIETVKDIINYVINCINQKVQGTELIDER